MLDLGDVEGCFGDFPEDEQERREQAEVANTSDDERLLGGGGSARLVEPEADEQVRTKADQLPEDEDLKEVVREDEPEHGEGEQAQVGEVAAFAVVAIHVPRRIKLDEE